ncbi:MAG TPA: erythromycin esterase family protein, partial [Chthoniobacteraceae bacterium]
MLSTKTLTRLLPLAALALSSCGGGSSVAPGEGTGVTGAPPQTGAPPPSPDALASIRAAARPVVGAEADHSEIIAAAASARRVLLGESTHGTSEYYRERGRLTERLARDGGFGAVTIEGDWTPTFRVNLYVKGLGTDRTAAEALQGHGNRFPKWMWRNAEFADFVERLRALKSGRLLHQRVGIYGMDDYDLYEA